jgi:hypothetical protein
VCLEAGAFGFSIITIIITIILAFMYDGRWLGKAKWRDVGVGGSGIVFVNGTVVQSTITISYFSFLRYV